MRKQALTSEERTSVKKGLSKRAKAIDILRKRERQRAWKRIFFPWTDSGANLSRQDELDAILGSLD